MKKFWQFLPFVALSVLALWLYARYGTPAALGIFVGIAYAFALLLASGIPLRRLNDLMTNTDKADDSSFLSTQPPKRWDDR